MRKDWWVPAMAAAALVIIGGASDDLVDAIIQTPAARLDSGLPDRPFGEWLRGQLPPGAVPVFRSRPCSDGRGRCLVVEAEIVSRARTLHLEFATEDLTFRGGRPDAPDAARPLPIDRLAELPDRLSHPIRLEPVSCPDGTRAKLRESDAGLHAWCENADGRKHGPARSWFSTGRYLMSRGRYEEGERVGEWIECSRFEQCRKRSYD